MGRIIKVCVYPDRALVTREIKLSGTSGDNVSEFRGITPLMESDSLRVKGKGALIITDSSLSQEFLRDTNLGELNRLESLVEETGFKLEALENRKQRLAALGSFLEQMDLQDISEIHDFNTMEIVDTEEIQKLLEQHAEILKDISTKSGTANIEIKKLKKELKKLSYTAARLKEPSSRSAMNCTVNFRMEKSGEAVIRISYIVPGASWSPLYDGRLLYREREFELVQYAEVIQNTGEEWADIKLELSTARPSSGANLPEPEPWYLDIYRPPPPPAQASRMKKKSRGMREEMDEFDDDSIDLAMESAPEEFDSEVELASAMMSGSGMEMPDAKLDHFSVAEVSSSGFNATFTSGALQNIPTGGSPGKVMLGIERFPAVYEYIIMPAVEEAAFLKIKIKNNLEYPVLRGPVKIYRDYSFLGESVIDNIVPGEELKLFMGVDDSLKVKRELVSRNRDRKGITGRDTSMEYEYRITIESFKDHDEDITVIEQVPVSRNREIEVRFRNRDGFSEPDEKGIIRAEFRIKPKEKREIGYSFTVRYPSDIRVYGIDGI